MRYAMCLLILVGCATPEQERARQAAEQAEYQQLVFQRCRSYGFTDATPEFRQCVMQVDMAARQMLQQHTLQEESMRRQRAMPMCSTLPPGTAGYMRSQGRCR